MVFKSIKLSGIALLAVIIFVIGFDTGICQSLKQEQENFKHLSTKQFYSDFDSLLHYIRSIDSYHIINKKLKGIDFEEQATEIKKEIGNIKDNGEYLRLIKKTLNLLQDNHASITRGASSVSIRSLNPKDTLQARVAAQYYDSLYTRYISDRRPNIEIPLKYISGEYKTYYPFSFKGTRIDSGFTVAGVNGRHPQDLINSQYTVIPDLLYDIDENHLYTERFYQVPEFYKNSMLNLDFKREEETIRLTFHHKDSLSLDEKINQVSFNSNADARKVVFLEEEKILYIRMPQMIHADFYIEEIKKLMDQHPAKVVFDIRGNGGGTDYTWAAPLRMIIGDSLKRSFFVGIKNNPLMDTLAKRTFHPVWFDSSRITHSIFRSELLDGEEYKSFKVAPNNVSPDSINMGFKGNIFILADRYHYSSTGNLLSLAKANENVISVGMTSGRYGGVQFSPVQVMLPYSKITLRFEPVLDFSQASTVKGFYHNYVDVPYEYTVEDYFRLSIHDGDVSDLDFLLKHDPLMKIIMDYPDK